MSETIILKIPIRALRDLLDAASVAIDEPPRSATPTEGAADPRNGNGAPFEPWTDKQRRYVYRLLLRLGHEGDAARTYLERVLRLNGKPPSRRQASDLIDQLQGQLADREGSRDDAA